MEGLKLFKNIQTLLIIPNKKKVVLQIGMMIMLEIIIEKF